MMRRREWTGLAVRSDEFKGRRPTEEQQVDFETWQQVSMESFTECFPDVARVFSITASRFGPRQARGHRRHLLTRPIGLVAACLEALDHLERKGALPAGVRDRPDMEGVRCDKLSANRSGEV
jgi:hypothetical protein